MRKFIIGWLLLFVGLVFWLWLDKKIQPQVIEMPVMVEKIVEVEIPVFKGEKIVEKIVYQPTELAGIFTFEQLNSPDYDLSYRMTINTSQSSDITIEPSREDKCVYIGIKHVKPQSRAPNYGSSATVDVLR